MIEFTPELKSRLEQQVRGMVEKGQNQAALELSLTRSALQVVVDEPTSGWELFIESQTLLIGGSEHSYFVGCPEE